MKKPKKQLTTLECIAIVKKCRKRIAFGQGMQYAIKQDRTGHNAWEQGAEIVRKHKARLAEITQILESRAAQMEDIDD